jgi:hypothetical protein
VSSGDTSPMDGRRREAYCVCRAPLVMLELHLRRA